MKQVITSKEALLELIEEKRKTDGIITTRELIEYTGRVMPYKLSKSVCYNAINCMTRTQYRDGVLQEFPHERAKNGCVVYRIREA